MTELRTTTKTVFIKSVSMTVRDCRRLQGGETLTMPIPGQTMACCKYGLVFMMFLSVRAKGAGILAADITNRLQILKAAFISLRQL